MKPFRNTSQCLLPVCLGLLLVLPNVSSSDVTSTPKSPPGNVETLNVLTQTETTITLSWRLVDNITTYFLKYENNGNIQVDFINKSSSVEESSITHVVSSLTSGKKYNFTLITTSDGQNSTGSSFVASTAPPNPQDFREVDQSQDSITLQWKRVDGVHLYWIEFMDGSERRVVNVSASTELEVTEKISDLKSMTKYNFTLFSVFENIRSSGVDHSAFTASVNPEDFREVNQSQDSITLKWKRVDGIRLYQIEFMDGSERRVVNVSASTELEVTKQISNLKSMTKYDFTLFSVFENIRSSGVDHSAFTAPSPVSEVKTVDQTETSITLQWRKVTGVEYKVRYNGEDANISATEAKEHSNYSTYIIHGLSSGTAYHFKIFALFHNIQSPETNYTAATVPSMVPLVNVTSRTTTSLTLSWNTEADKDWNYILDINGKKTRVTSTENIPVESLQPGTVYPFSVTTEFYGLNSTTYEDFSVTKIDCADGTWNVTNSSIHGEVEGQFTYATASNASQDSLTPRQNNLSFTDLYPGATYEVALFYEEDDKTLEQCRHQLTILPSDIVARCKYWAAGYSIFVVWDKPYGVWTAVEVSVRGQNYTIKEDDEQSLNVSGFLPARTYEVSVALLSGPSRNSKPYVFSCLTDPRGVIAGSFFAVLIFLILVCLTVFILLRRPDIISRRKSFIGGSKGAGGSSHKKSKTISVARFPEHLYTLSADENRGFSLEYEDLIPVGKEQTQRVALLPENKPRNRFVNIQPYDWCRVKLNTPDPNMFSDYINANYLPGYSHSREYIATQGPLPTTVNDFWRMIWEQSVKGIVMVTNCVEGGRTKCEQYWPAYGEENLYGDLLVTTRSELEEPSWTLREFNIKHDKTLEERRVKHFHFTAWPDHGVPQGTEVLIHFRSLLRHHIQREGSRAPTVVHCSAGVGRTGTIIALDVLLQQLESEKAVDINAFVRKMRLCRPHMVQTESQYVFLHQCIMDSLQSNGTEDNIYENTDTIYVNATALKALDSNAYT